MIDKLERLDQLIAMIDDENLREEITDITLKILIEIDEEKLKKIIFPFMNTDL